MPPFDTEAGSFEWTPEGRRLLKEFKIEIQNSGGIGAVYRRVKRESNIRLYKHKISEIPVSSDSIIFNNWNKHTVAEIADMIKKARSYVWDRAKFLGLPDKKREGWNTDMIHHNKPVTNGYVTFNTINEAAEYLGMKPKTLSAMLRGENRNKTNFRVI